MHFNPSSINECPSCKSIISFTGTSTNFIVCRVCGTALHNQNGNDLAEFAVNTSFAKTDFIQPGTTGQWNKESFTVLGRFRTFFDEAAFNYWTIEWQTKKIGYLAEAYGLFSILQPVELNEPLTIAVRLKKMKTGGLLDILPRQDFLLEKDQPLLDMEAEGEFFLPVPEKKFTVCDFAAKDGKKMTLFDFNDDRIFAFDQEAADFAGLKFENTRTAQAEPKNYTCVQCNSQISVKTFPYAQSCACMQCSSFYRITMSGELKKIQASPVVEAPAIPPGTTGLLLDIPYEVLGYTQKEEKNIYKSQWREYTLYNPQQGYAFLSEYDGHWILLKERIDSPVLFHKKEKNFNFDNKQFLLFNTYKYNVTSARGEFPHHIFNNGETECSEYILPPEIWIQEKDPKEGIRWFNGHHISHVDVKKAFSVQYMPLRTGTGAVQPGSMRNSQLIRGTLVALLVLVLTSFLTNIGKKEQVLFDQYFTFPDSSNTLQIVTPHYELDKRRSNLRFDVYADVSNSWFELNATLVNVKTGKQYNLEKGVEYYHGYSDGESWSEGSSREVAYFTRVPAGTYFLEMAGMRESGLNQANHFSLKITYDVPSMRNLWIVLILFLSWPLIKFLLIRFTETARWRNSPYAAQHNIINEED